MKTEDTRALYGPAYADRYENLWQDHPFWIAEARNYVQSLGDLISPQTRWLDVGCGTGWFLSRFPGVERGGVDLSPAMLEKARENNPDAAFFREGDIRDDVPEWHDGFTLVSSTGQAWGYVDSMAEVERIAHNMARWTAPDGVLFVQPPDLFDLTGHQLDYDFSSEPPPLHSVRITGAIWSFYDEAGAHENQVYPSLDVWVRWLSRWFRRIEVHTWPHDPPAPYLPGPRKLLLAMNKRGPNDDGAAAEIVVMPPEGATAAEGATMVAEDSASTAEPATAAEGETTAAPLPGPGERIPGRRLLDQPLSYLVHRVRPTDPRFWLSAARRVRRRLW